MSNIVHLSGMECCTGNVVRAKLGSQPQHLTLQLRQRSVRLRSHADVESDRRVRITVAFSIWCLTGCLTINSMCDRSSWLQVQVRCSRYSQSRSTLLANY